MNEQLQAAFEYLEKALVDGSLENKRILNVEDGDCKREELEFGAFALEQKYTTKERSKCFIESHRKYVDLQLCITGLEIMEHTDIKKLTVDESYCESRDLITYHDYPRMNKITLESGDLAIFFPEDGHMGGQMFETSGECVKTVIKMPLKYFN